MNLQKKHTLLSLLFLIVFSPIFSFAKSNWDEEAKKRKAEYVHFEASIQQMAEKALKYCDLLNYSYNLDSTNMEVMFQKGLFDTYSLTKPQAENGYRLMKKHFEQGEKDFNTNFSFCTFTAENRSLDEALKASETLKSRFPDKAEALLLHALLLSQGDSIQMRKAIDEYNKIEENNGKTVALCEKKIMTYLNLNDTAKINEEIDGLLKSDTTEINNILFAASIYNYILHDSLKAVSYFDKAYDLDSSSDLVISSRLTYFSDTNDSIALHNEIENAIKNPDVSIDSKRTILNQLTKQFYNNPTKMNNIREYYSLLTKTHPNEGIAHLESSAVLLYLRDYEAANKELSLAIEVDSTNEQYWVNYINTSTLTENKKKTYEIIDKANALFPNSSPIKYLSGVAYQSFDDYNTAIDYYSQVINSSDSIYYESAYCSLGDLYGEKEMFDSAYYHYEKSLELNPSNINTLNNYAYFLAVNNTDLDKAEQMSYITVMDSATVNATYLDTYAWIKFLKIEYLEARNIIDYTLEIGGDSSAEILHHAGDIYFMCGDPDKALEFWNKALAIMPDDKLLQKKVKYKTFFYK